MLTVDDAWELLELHKHCLSYLAASCLWLCQQHQLVFPSQQLAQSSHLVAQAACSAVLQGYTLLGPLLRGAAAPQQAAS